MFPITGQYEAKCRGAPKRSFLAAGQYGTHVSIWLIIRKSSHAE
jgi:hypothetical protein